MTGEQLATMETEAAVLDAGGVVNVELGALVVVLLAEAKFL